MHPFHPGYSSFLERQAFSNTTSGSCPENFTGFTQRLVNVQSSEELTLTYMHLFCCRHRAFAMLFYFFLTAILSNKLDFAQFSCSMLVFLASSSVMSECVLCAVRTLSCQRTHCSRGGKSVNNDNTVFLGRRAGGNLGPLSI